MASTVGTTPQLEKVESSRRTIRTYLELTKLRIVTLLLFTTLTAMVIAAGGIPHLAILLPTLLGGALSAAGASVINQYFDRDMDAQMNRTARRPIPSGRVEPVNALLFGLALIVWSTLILGVFVNWLAAVLALGGAVYYVVIYTMLLKRNTVAQHPDRRRRGRDAGAGRLGGGHGRPELSGIHPVCDCLLLDTAA